MSVCIRKLFVSLICFAILMLYGGASVFAESTRIIGKIYLSDVASIQSSEITASFTIGVYGNTPELPDSKNVSFVLYDYKNNFAKKFVEYNTQTIDLSSKSSAYSNYYSYEQKVVVDKDLNYVFDGMVNSYGTTTELGGEFTISKTSDNTILFEKTYDDSKVVLLLSYNPNFKKLPTKLPATINIGVYGTTPDTPNGNNVVFTLNNSTLNKKTTLKNFDFNSFSESYRNYNYCTSFTSSTNLEYNSVYNYEGTIKVYGKTLSVKGAINIADILKSGSEAILFDQILGDSPNASIVPKPTPTPIKTPIVSVPPTKTPSLRTSSTSTVPPPPSEIPGTPQLLVKNLIGSVSNGKVHLVWQLPRRSDIAGFFVYSTKVQGSYTSTPLNDFPTKYNSFIDTKADTSTSTYYKVAAVSKDGGVLGYSNEVELKPNNKKIVLNIGNPYMNVNEELKEIDPGRNTSPIIESNRVMLPIRSIIEELGGEVTWDQTQKRLDISSSDNDIILWIDSNKALVNGTETSLDVSPKIIGGRTFVPLRFIIEKLGYDANWDPSKKVTITN